MRQPTRPGGARRLRVGFRFGRTRTEGVGAYRTSCGFARRQPEADCRLAFDRTRFAGPPRRRLQPFIWAWDETFDVGLDAGTSVDDADYQAPFAFTGTLGKITFDLGETSMTSDAIEAMMEELAKKRDR